MTDMQSNIKAGNIEILLNALLQKRPVSRVELTRVTELSPPTVTRITSMLKAKGFCHECGTLADGLGRHAIKLDTIAERAYAIGIELKLTSYTIVIIDMHRELVALTSIRLNILGAQVDEVADSIYTSVQKFVAERGIPETKISGIGISVPGIVDNEEGVVTLSTQFDWKNVPLRALFAERFNKVVFVENDSKARMIAENCVNKLPDINDSAILMIGNGVSAAAMSKGKIIRGSHNAAGEVGHIRYDQNGLLCDCGNRGCLQTCLASSFLLRSARAEDPAIESVEDIISAAQEGRSWALRIVKDFKKAFNLAIEILRSCYNPRSIFVSGDVACLMKEYFETQKDNLIEIQTDTLAAVNISFSPESVSAYAVGSAIIALRSSIIELICRENQVHHRENGLQI